MPYSRDTPTPAQALVRAKLDALALVPVLPGNPVEHFGNAHGHGPGRPKGTLNQLNRIIKDRMSEAIARGEKMHPAEILLDIANDHHNEVEVRVRASAAWLDRCMPKLQSIQVETTEKQSGSAKAAMQERVATALSAIASELGKVHDGQ